MTENQTPPEADQLPEDPPPPWEDGPDNVVPISKGNGEDDAEKTYMVLSLADLGPQLPIGHKGAEGYVRELSHKRWNVKMEKQISKLREQNRSANEAKFASMILSHVYDRIGAIAYDSGAVVEKKERKSTWYRALARIGDMYFADVLYAYCYLRYCVLGASIDMELACMKCGHTMPYQADLGTLEIRIPKDPDNMSFDFHLTDPFKVRGKECTGFTFGPGKWNAIESMQLAGQLDSGAAKSALVWGSIRGLLPATDFENVAVAEHELDEMGKRDFEYACALLDANVLGPDMSIDTQCPKCNQNNLLSIDWRYETFFGVSGRSGRSRK